MKRRIADLPPLTKESFEAKAREYARVASGQSAAGTDTELYCPNCRKSFQVLFFENVKINDNFQCCERKVLNYF